MKNTSICLALLFVTGYHGHAQNVIIKGRVRCLNQSVSATKGAENIIVIPSFIPAKSSVTATDPPGYFELNTGISLSQLQDKQVTVYSISGCKSCPTSVKRVFVSADQNDGKNDNGNCYITIKNWQFNKNCNEVELPPIKADSILNIIVRQPAEKMNAPGATTALVGSPALLNLITTITTVLPPVGAIGFYKASSLEPGKIHYGNFLAASALVLTPNTGFNFSPARDVSEAVFWNPAAITASHKPYNISLFTNLKNNIKAGGFLKVTDKFSLGGGFIYTMQDEFRGAVYEDISGGGGASVFTDSLQLNLKEFAAFLSPSLKLGKKINVGLTVKSIWQHFNSPNLLNIDSDNKTTLTDSIVNLRKFDVDVSAIFKVTNALQVGINLMNLAGTKLYADAFVPDQPNIAYHNQRSLGIGLCYKWHRFNFGVDVLFTDKDFYDAALGVNYVPFNNALIMAGVAVKQASYSVAFKFSHFKISYVNDNGYLANNRKTGKSAILNGKIYGGFCFDF
jgi:hypothetical protein